MKQFYIYIFLIFLCKESHSITKQCSLDANPLNHQLKDNHLSDMMINQCPINSHCMSNKFCACDQGFIGGCTQAAFFVSNGKQIRTKINDQNYTFFQVSVDSDSFIILVFNLCHNEASQNLERIDVWDDNGSIDIFDKTNALPGSKNWNINASCLRLNTPFLIFGKQPNGLPQDFIFGIKLVNPGEIEIGLTVEIQIVDFWDLVIKILVIVGACFVLAFIIGLVFILYKCRRRRLFLQAYQRAQQKNIDHFKQFMPEYKLKSKNSTNDDVCSICLADFQIGDELRMTICSHVFHKDCIDGWCKSALNCPVCRTDLDRQALHLMSNGDSFNLNQPSINQQNLRQPLL